MIKIRMIHRIITEIKSIVHNYPITIESEISIFLSLILVSDSDDLLLLSEYNFILLLFLLLLLLRTAF